MTNIVLTNDKQRKHFLENYSDESLGWEVHHHDEANNFIYYRCRFEDGSFITVLTHRKASVMPIKTLTKADGNYFPIWTTQSDLIKHLKDVAGKKVSS